MSDDLLFGSGLLLCLLACALSEAIANWCRRFDDPRVAQWLRWALGAVLVALFVWVAATES